MSTPTLPASWTPTQAGCLRTTDYWVWEYNAKAGDARTVLGGPSQITACFPSTWDGSLIYAGTACPTQYTSACQDSNAVVTCCPTVYDYGCQSRTWSPGVHADMFRCVSQYGTTGTMTVTQTDFAVNTVAIQQRNMQSDLHLFALAIMYTEPAATASVSATGSTFGPSIPTATGETTGEATGGSQGLTNGQVAGVAVGVAAAGFIIGFMAWFTFRRRKHAQGLNQQQPQPQQQQQYPSSEPPSEFAGAQSRGLSSRQETATELESEDPMPWGEAVKEPWQIKTPR